MRIIFAGAWVAISAMLGGCALERAIAAKECTDFYDHTRDRQVTADGLEAACACAVEREAAGQTPTASVPPRSNPALPDYRRHLPDCLQANGGSATGVAARESSGAAPRLPTFDRATGQVTEPPDQVRPRPGEPGAQPVAEGPTPGTLPGMPAPPPVVRGDNRGRGEVDRALEDANRELENAMRSIEGR